MRQLEDEQARRLERPAPIRTRNVRRIRRQAYKVACTRIMTALKRREPATAGIVATMERLGL